MTATGSDRPTTEAPDATADGSSTPSLWQRLRDTGFGPADEHPYRRRFSDWVRLGVALAFLAWSIPHHGHLLSVEEQVFRVFNELPDGMQEFMRVVYALGRAVGGVHRGVRRDRRPALAPGPGT